MCGCYTAHTTQVVDRKAAGNTRLTDEYCIGFRANARYSMMFVNTQKGCK